MSAVDDRAKNGGIHGWISKTFREILNNHNDPYHFILLALMEKQITLQEFEESLSNKNHPLYACISLGICINSILMVSEKSLHESEEQLVEKYGWQLTSLGITHQQKKQKQLKAKNDGKKGGATRNFELNMIKGEVHRLYIENDKFIGKSATNIAMRILPPKLKEFCKRNGIKKNTYGVRAIADWIRKIRKDEKTLQSR